MRRSRNLSWLVGAILLSSCVREPKIPQSPINPAPNRFPASLKREIELRERLAQDREFDLIIVGDSIVQLWETVGASSWERLNSRVQALNLGVGGDRTQNVLFRLGRMPTEDTAAKRVLIELGTNNCGDGNEPAEIVSGIIEVQKALQRCFINAQITVVPPFPRLPSESSASACVEEVRRLLFERQRMGILDLLDPPRVFFAAAPDEKTSLYSDSVHLSEAGYEMWGKQIERWLQVAMPTE